MLPEGYCFSAKVIIIILFPLQNYVTMLRRKFKYEKLIKSNNSKNKKGRVMVLVHCTPPKWDLSTYEVSSS